jgi:CBS domain-containing protein
MIATKPLSALTAGEVMSREIVTISQDIRLRDAAQRLAAAGVHGAPVVDGTGRCVGILSVSDIARWVARLPAPPAGAFRTCPYCELGRGAAGQNVAVCKLAPGACVVQRQEAGPGGELLTTCAAPFGVCVGEWQILEPEALPSGFVREQMTADPVMAPADTPLGKLARMMIDASVHRVIIVDVGRRPVGIVSCTDLIAAIARCASEVGSG